jgi:hypothetical protein
LPGIQFGFGQRAVDPARLHQPGQLRGRHLVQAFQIDWHLQRAPTVLVEAWDAWSLGVRAGSSAHGSRCRPHLPYTMN